MTLRSKKAKKSGLYSHSQRQSLMLFGALGFSPKMLLFDTPPLLSGFLLVAQANQDLTMSCGLTSNSSAVLLPQPPECWQQRPDPACPALVDLHKS